MRERGRRREVLLHRGALRRRRRLRQRVDHGGDFVRCRVGRGNGALVSLGMVGRWFAEWRLAVLFFGDGSGAVGTWVFHCWEARAREGWGGGGGRMGLCGGVLVLMWFFMFREGGGGMGEGWVEIGMKRRSGLSLDLEVMSSACRARLGLHPSFSYQSKGRIRARLFYSPRLVSIRVR